MTDSRDTILVVFDGPGDTTIRPARHPILREYPRPLVLPPELGERLRGEAERLGVRPHDLVRRLLEEHLPPLKGDG